VHSEGRTEARV